MSNRRSPYLFGLACLLLGCPPDLHGQGAPLPGRVERPPAPLGTLAANTVLGIGVAATGQLVRGEFSLREIGRAALGGGIVYAGKRVAVERFYGAGLVGRQLHAVGASLVENAARGQGSVGELALPVGPVRFYVDRADGLRIRPKLDLATSVAAAHAATRPGMRWDPSASLSAGALVFRTSGRAGGLATAAKHGAGVLRIEADEAHWQDPETYAHQLFAHERVHVLQYDLAQHWAGRPVQRWAEARVPGLRPIGRHLDLGAAMPLWGAANLTIPYEHRPWEKEARLLESRPRYW